MGSCKFSGRRVVESVSTGGRAENLSHGASLPSGKFDPLFDPPLVELEDLQFGYTIINNNKGYSLLCAWGHCTYTCWGYAGGKMEYLKKQKGQRNHEDSLTHCFCFGTEEGT